jgi:hypothetical protein
MEDDDFCEKIQDIRNAQTNTHLEEGKLLFVHKKGQGVGTTSYLLFWDQPLYAPQ